MRQGKMKLGVIAIWVIGILAVGWLASEAGILNTDKLSALDVTGDDTQTASESAVLANVQPSVNPSPRDVYNDSVTAGGTCTAYVDGVKQSCTSGTAFNVNAGGTYEVLFDDGQHYQARAEGKAPVNGAKVVQLEIYPNATLSSVFFNSAGTAATAQALGAADEKFVKVRFTSTNDKTFSNPQSDANPIICLDYNTTSIDKIEVVGSGKVGIPQQAVGTYEECYAAPFKSLSDGQEYDVQFLVDADDSVNPAADDATAIVYDMDLFIAATGPNIGDRLYGVENIAGTDIGGANPTVTLDFS